MNRSGRIRVLIADDHTIVRQGLRAILDAEAGMTVVGEAADGREAVEMARTLAPDVVVMDVSMPRMNGLEATTRVLAAHPGTRVVALTMHNTDEYVYEVLKAGASGYLLKESATSELVAAIRAVRDGATYLHPAISARVVNGFLKQPDSAGGVASRDVLSSRERGVLQLIAEGHTSKQIAAKLAISVKTVENHRTRIMDKLQIHNVAGLTRYAVSRGLTTAAHRG